uniref:PGG domain-containing protein n=1 Tax=Oryza punctata TaxID=4537 RepID=A0A0E0LZZ1_ORYPU
MAVAGDRGESRQFKEDTTMEIPVVGGGMHRLLLAAACSGDCEGLSFLLSGDGNSLAHPTTMKPSKKFLNLIPARNGSSPSDIEECTNIPSMAAESLLEGVTVDGNTALHVVATHGNGPSFLKCAKVIHRSAKHLLFQPNNNGDTPLHCAVRAGNPQMVSQLVDLATELCVTEANGVNVVKDLLRKENNSKETVLHQAVCIGDNLMVKLLLTYDSELARFPQEGTSPLYLAILLEKNVIAQTLYDMSERNILSYAGPNGQNALHAAVFRGKEMTERLLRWKNDLSEERDKYGSTPLHFAASVESSLHNRFSSKAIISKVLEASPSSVFQPDNEESLPIHVAASAGVRSAIALLIEKWPGCASFRDSDGRTFLHIAVEKQRNDIVRFASRKVLSSVLNMQDNEGNTALHLAVQLGNLSIVCSLLGNKRVLLNLTNTSGQTPLDVARRKIPTGIFYGWVIYFLNLEETIHHALVRSGAKHGTIRWDQLQQKHIPPGTAEDDSNESQILSDSTQTLAIGSVLIATVTFGATFALPGGYRADDHINGGSPTLAGRYTFDAFIMATTLAFICSSIATLDLMYSGISMVNLPVRRKHFAVSIFFLTSSGTSLVAAFALGVYMVLAPVDDKTGIAICVLSPFTMLYRNKGRLQKLYALAGPLYIRMGLWALLSLTKDILSGVLKECWTLILIFGWAGYTTYCRHHR